MSSPPNPDLDSPQAEPDGSLATRGIGPSRYPYPGLRPFRRSESDIFFGRDEQVDQLLIRLEDDRLSTRSGSEADAAQQVDYPRRFLAVVGPSGCGKSSLVRAGMIPALEAGFMASAGVRWHVATMRPGNAPFINLAKALLKTSLFTWDTSGTPEDEEALGEHRDEDKLAFLRATLRRGPLGLVDALRERQHISETKVEDNLLVVVDQFEEIFDFERRGGATTAKRFVSLLLGSAKQVGARIFIVITMRTDHLGNCPIFMGLPEAINEGLFLTPRLTPAQIESAIVRPAEMFESTLESSVVNQILSEMGTDPDQLPQMQHLLMCMWRRAYGRAKKTREATRLTLKDYCEVGGLSHALSDHANRTFGQRLETDRQRQIAERMFRCLTKVTPDGKKVRNPQKLADICEAVGARESEVIAVIDRFRTEGRSFLTPPKTDELTGESRIDISHESLIRQWNRLNDWVDQEANSAKEYLRVEETAQRWKRGEAGFLHAPDLDTALTWQEEQHPSATWAKRYGGDYDLAIQFLDASKSKREKDRLAAEEARQHELKQARALADAQKVRADEQAKLALVFRRFTAWLTFVLVLLLIAAGAAYLQWKNARDAAVRAECMRLVAESKEALADYPQRSLLLAVEAIRVGTARLGAQLPQGARDNLSKVFQRFVESGLECQSFHGHRVGSDDVAIDRNNKWLARDDGTGAIHLWNLEENKAFTRVISVIDDDDLPSINGSHVAFSPSGTWLIGHVRLFDGKTTSSRVRLCRMTESGPSAEFNPFAAKHKKAIEAVALNDKWLVTASDDAILFWELKSDGSAPNPISRQVQQKQLHVAGVQFSPDGEWLLTSCANGERHSPDFKTDVRLWQMNEKGPILVPDFAAPSSSLFAFSSNSKFLLAKSDQAVRLWNLQTNKFGPDHKLNPRHAEVHSVKFSPDSKFIVLSDLAGKAVSILKLDDRQMMTPVSLSDQSANYSKVAVGPAKAERMRLATADDGTLRLWELNPEGSAEKPIVLLKRNGIAVDRIEFSNDGEWLAAAGSDKIIRLWDLTDPMLAGARPIEMRVHDDPIEDLEFVCCHERAKWLISRSADRSARLWDLPTRTSLVLPEYESEMQPAAVFGTGGQVFLTSGAESDFSDSSTRLWRWESNRFRMQASGPEQSRTTTLAISPNNEWVVTGSRDGTVRTSKLTGDYPLNNYVELEQHAGLVSAIAFSPDGKWIATGGFDKKVRVSRMDDVKEQWGAKSNEDSEKAAPVPSRQSLPVGAVSAIAFRNGETNQGPLLLTACLPPPASKPLVEIWESGNGKDPFQPFGHLEVPFDDEWVTELLFSSDGKWLFTGTTTKPIAAGTLPRGGGYLWKWRQNRAAGEPLQLNMRTASEIRSTSRNSIASPPPSSAAFSSGNAWFAASIGNEKVCLWKISDLERNNSEKSSPRVFSAQQAVLDVCFLDDMSVVIADTGGNVAIREVAEIKRPFESLPLFKQLELARKTAGRPFTDKEKRDYAVHGE